MIESNYEVEIDRGDLELALKERGRDKIAERSAARDYVSTTGRRSVSSPVNGNVVTTVLGRISRSND